MQEIICVLDKSGSMQAVSDDATAGFNAFIEEQKKIDDANITLVWFDTKIMSTTTTLSAMEKIERWPNGGATALLDAIGAAIKNVEKRFSEEKPEKVIMAIMTDGHENASKEFTREAVASLVKHHQDKYGWDVIFLAADQDAWATAKHLNIRKENAINYSSHDTVGGMTAYSNAVTRGRTGNSVDSVNKS